MITAVKVLRDLTERVSEKTQIDVTFQHGNTLTVVNYITKLRESRKVYPAIILFTENLTETNYSEYVEFSIPKIAICTTTVEDATERQRLESNFENIIFPVFRELEREIKRVHLGFDLVINRTDIPYFSENQLDNKFNQLVDGCLIRNLKIRVKKTC